MSYPSWLEALLRCPQTLEPLTRSDDGYRRPDGKTYRVIDGILSIVHPAELSGQDAEFNQFYDRLAPLYDLNERVFGRLIAGIDMATGRREIVSRLPLQRGCRLLEVSPGPGVFQPHLRDAIGPEGEFVSLDLSLGMLRQCQHRNGRLDVQLIHANGQHLPFEDASFDAVFHFGGVNLFNDPDRALAEFARVTRPGGLVSWGDEGFAPSYPNGLRKKMMSRINPGFTKPRPALPAEVEQTQVHEVYGGLGYLVVAQRIVAHETVEALP